MAKSLVVKDLFDDTPKTPQKSLVVEDLFKESPVSISTKKKAPVRWEPWENIPMQPLPSRQKHQMRWEPWLENTSPIRPASPIQQNVTSVPQPPRMPSILEQPAMPATASQMPGVITQSQPIPLPDIGRISTPVQPTTVEPTALEKAAYPLTRAYSAVIERPLIYAPANLLARGLRAADKYLPRINYPFQQNAAKKVSAWLDDLVNVTEQPEKYGLATPSAERVRGWVREKAYQKNFLSGIISDVADSTTEFVALLAQLALIKKVTPASVAKIAQPFSSLGKKVATMGIHGAVTTPGPLKERVKAGTYRIAYSITPYIANATGATGLGAVAVDTMLNTFLTMPTYSKALKEAGGFNKKFLSLALPQFIMDVGMAWRTRGLPENIFRNRIERYMRGRVNEMKMPRDEALHLIKNLQNIATKPAMPGEKPQPFAEKINTDIIKQEHALLTKARINDTQLNTYLQKDPQAGQQIRDITSKVLQGTIPEEQALQTFAIKIGNRSPEMARAEFVAPSALIKDVTNKIIEGGAETREKIYQEYINRFQSLENVSKELKKQGVVIRPGEDPGLLARSYLGTGQKVNDVLQNETFKINPDGTLKVTGEGLKPILDGFEKSFIDTPQGIQKGPYNKLSEERRGDLVDYLKAQRYLKDLQRTVEVKGKQKKIATDAQTIKSQQDMARLTEKYQKLHSTQEDPLKQFSDTATRLYEFQKRILHLLVDSGNMTQQRYDDIVQKNSHYIPFDRIREQASFSGGTPKSKNRFTKAQSPVKKIQGSEKETYDPIESIIQNTYKIMDASERNTVTRSLANLAQYLPEKLNPIKVKFQPIKLTEQEAGEIKTIFRPSQFAPKGNVLEYYDGGKRKFLEVTPNIYQAATGLNETGLDVMAKILSKPANWLRTGATITPEFMTRNPFRDQMTALMQTSVGFVPFVDTVRAMGDILKSTDTYHDWLRSGGAYSGFVELSRPNLQKAYKELIKPMHKRMLSKLNIISTAQDISQFFEQATRVGLYKASIRKGLSPLEAGFQSREGTIDFARKGSKMKNVNASIAFFNAGIQGADKSFRSFAADPVGFTLKGLATITIPTLLLYLKNRNDPDYKEIPRWQRDLFWVTKVGEWKTPEDIKKFQKRGLYVDPSITSVYVRIPKAFLYGQVFGSLPERFMEYIDTKNPDAFNGIIQSIYDSLAPINGDPSIGMTPTGLRPLVENATNWNFFLERNIVPTWKLKMDKKYQYTEQTSQTAKLFGKAINQSPAKIENLVRGILGGTGGYLLQGGDLLLRQIQGETKKQRPRELSDVPLVKGFVTRPVYSGTTESMQKFYRNRDKAIAAKSSYDQMIKEENYEEAKKIIKEMPAWQYKQALDSFYEIIKAYSETIDALIEQNIPDDKKRSQIRVYEKKRNDIARQANKMFDDFMGKNKKKSLVVEDLF